VAKGYVRKWADLFRDLEQNHGLNVELQAHLWLLHHLFLASVNSDAVEWALSWNNHPMRLPRGERGGRSPIGLYSTGIATNGVRGFDAIDAAYDEDPENYGVDWADADDQTLTTNLRRRADEARQNAPDAFAPAPDPPPNVFVNPHSAPPRWSRVVVEPPRASPLTDDEISSLDAHISTRVDRRDRSMDSKRRIWIHALQFSTQLFDRHVD
jgi:hypothetical protein